MPELNLVQSLTIAVSALTGGVVVLFLWFKDSYSRLEAREQRCLEDYKSLLERVIAFEQKEIANQTRENKR